MPWQRWHFIVEATEVVLLAGAACGGGFVLAVGEAEGAVLTGGGGVRALVVDGRLRMLVGLEFTSVVLGGKDVLV